MSAGLFGDKEHEDRLSFTEEDLERVSVNPPVRRDNKKTPAQKRKQKERELQVCISIFFLQEKTLKYIRLSA